MGGLRGLVLLFTLGFGLSLSNTGRMSLPTQADDLKLHPEKVAMLAKKERNESITEAIHIVDKFLAAAKLDNKTIDLVNKLINTTAAPINVTKVVNGTAKKNATGYQCGVCTALSELSPDFMLDSRMHLPPNRPTMSCERLAGVSDDGKEFEQILSEIGSNNTDCVDGFRPKAVENGFGASLASLVKPLMHAVKFQQCVYTPVMKMWSGKKCNGFECFFQSLAPAAGTTRAPHVQFTEKDAAKCEEGYRNASFCPTWWNFQREQEDPPDNATEAALSDNCLYSYSFTELGEDVLPQEFIDNGLFFTVSHILKHIMRPNKKLAKMIQKAKYSMGWPNDTTTQVLSVHVRQGDACIKSSANFKGRQCDGLAHYIPAIQLMADTYGFKYIFLATDTAAVRESTEEYPQFKWLFQKESRYSQKRSHVLKFLPIEKALRYGVLDPFEEGAAYLVDVHLMASGHAFVGKFTSNLDRVVYNLMGSKSDCLRPFISLDSGWCFDYGLPNGDGDTGDFQC
uniref:Alpha-(1,6)-fucosyltransferase N- and catalytic domain-containing protein n=1 Tax=Lotharella globosa TaxID=91324 RepID=A0A7S3ZAW9_9EUKA